MSTKDDSDARCVSTSRIGRPSEMPTKTRSKICEEILGRLGRMISGSKSRYRSEYPDNVVVFNANVCIKSEGRVWFGDLDVTRDGERLRALAKELGEDVYVLHEMDVRPENERKPRFDHARAVISAAEVRIRK